MQTSGHVDPKSIESLYTKLPHKPAGANYPHLSAIHTMHILYDAQGFRVFFKGLSLNLIKGPIVVGISFTSFDFFREYTRLII
jgi:hypothetical protein